MEGYGCMDRVASQVWVSSRQKFYSRLKLGREEEDFKVEEWIEVGAEVGLPVFLTEGDLEALQGEMVWGAGTGDMVLKGHLAKLIKK